MADSIDCEDNKHKIEKVVPKTENELPGGNNLIESASIKKETQSVVDPTEFEPKPNLGRIRGVRVKKEEFVAAGGRVKKEEPGEPQDDKSKIRRVREVYRCLSPVVTKRKRGKKNEDKTYTVTENGEEGEDGEDDHLDLNDSENDDAEDREEIMITFVGNEPKWGRNREQRIRVMEYASLSMAFKEFTSRIDRTISYHTLRFLWDGQRLDGDRAAADYGLSDGDQIDVFGFQHGGGKCAN